MKIRSKFAFPIVAMVHALGCSPRPMAPPPADLGADVSNVVDAGEHDVLVVVDQPPVEDRTTTPDVPAAIDMPSSDVGSIDDGPTALDVPLSDRGTTLVDMPVVVDVSVANDVPTVRDYTRPGVHRVTAWNGMFMAGTDRNAMRVHYPTTEGTERFPLVVFAHGFQLAVGNYDRLLSHIASWGYVVVSVDYPGSILMVDHRRVAASLSAARSLFATGTVAGLAVASRVDARRPVVMGHSLGGKGAVMALLDDMGFVAGLALDPVDDNPSPLGRVTEATPSLAPERMPTLRRPLALFGATQSRCARLGQTCAPEASDYRQFAASAPTGTIVALWPLRDFGHMDFVDPGCGFACSACSAGAAPLDSRLAALRGLTVAFLERQAREDTSAQTYLDGPERAALVSSGVLWNGTPAALPPCR